MLHIATKPHFCMPLPNTPPKDVQSQVDSLLHTAANACPCTHKLDLLQLWMHVRALDWVVHNASGFIAGNRREQALQRKLMHRIMESARKHVPSHKMLDMERYHGMLLEGSHGIVRPLLMSSYRQFLSTLTEVVNYYDQKQLALMRSYDIVIMNVHFLRMMPAGQRTTFMRSMVKKWKESVEEWELFATLYPWEYMAPIVAFAEGVGGDAIN